MFEALCAKTYATHRHGVAVVTCAASPMGKAAVEALIEDGYLVRVREGGRRRASARGEGSPLHCTALHCTVRMHVGGSPPSLNPSLTQPIPIGPLPHAC